MKIQTIGGRVTATAETLEDVSTLMALSGGPRVYKKHKKHNFAKVCDLCGKSYKGLLGLNIHKAKCAKVGATSQIIAPVTQ